jgi:chlorophyllide a reductase subunit Y
MDGTIKPETGSCHGGKAQLRAAADAAGKSEVMARLAADYPQGPHDQPQSMCPAFGSLRVGLRMRRVATILSGSACCVYGLTFTSHFYGARRSVGYVPFDSETLVTGQLFEDIRKAVRETARPADYDAVVIINLCVPTASGVPLDLLPKEIDGVRIIGIDVPGFGVPTHAEAKDVLAGAMLKYARQEAERGAVARPRQALPEGKRISLIGELFPVDPAGIAGMIAICMARWTAASPLPCIRSTPRPCVNSRPPAAPSSAPRRSAWTAPPPGWRRSAKPPTSRPRWWTPRRPKPCPPSPPCRPPTKSPRA